jgi:predicted Zn-dependent protease
VTPEQRLEALRKLVEQKPDDAFARYSLAMAYRSAGRHEEAAQEFRELAQRKPDYVPTYLMLGQVLEALGHSHEAARVYEDGVAAATRGHDEHARSKLGEALENMKSQRSEEGE